MAVGTDKVRNLMRSINNTKSITKAMELVAGSRLQRTQNRMAASKPYARLIRRITGHMAHAHIEYRHPCLREIKLGAASKIGYIVVSTDRGLCGGLNSNLFRTVLSHARDNPSDIDPSFILYGNKANSYFKRLNANIIAEKTYYGDKPELAEVVGPISVARQLFNEAELDAVYVCYNQYVNTMTQKPVVEQLLPLEPVVEQEEQGHWDYLYEPEPVKILDQVIMRYIETQVYHAVLENVACEQAARMVAMKAATDNAGKVLDDLRLMYNKARQAAITQELAEIVGGSEAV